MTKCYRVLPRYRYRYRNSVLWYSVDETRMIRKRVPVTVAKKFFLESQPESQIQFAGGNFITLLKEP